MIGALGGALLAAAPTIAVRDAGIAGLLAPGPIPLRIDVDFGDLEPAAGALELEYVGADGDALRQKVDLAILPGTRTTRWMIVSPPASDTLLTASLLDGQGARLISAPPVSPGSMATPIKPGHTIMLVVGTDRGGLSVIDTAHDDLMSSAPTTTAAVLAYALPDSAEALDGIDTIIWSDGGIPEAPVARAVLDWVRGGGHLVLLPPALGAPWGEGAGDIAVEAGFDRPPAPANVPPGSLTRVFDGGAVGPDLVLPLLPRGEGWSVIQSDRDGRPTIVRRPLGFGLITAGAVDPSRRALAPLRTSTGMPAIVDLAMFWGPVLGRRDLPSITDMDRVVREGRLRSGLRRSTSDITDDLPGGWLTRTTSVSGRLLLAATLAVVYLVVAGPLLWRVLRRRGRTTLVWPGMVLCALSFAVLVLLLGSAVMPSSTDARHITVLDHVSGTPRHRVQSWIDLQLPGSGNRRVDVDDNRTESAHLRHWQPGSATLITFGDVRRLPASTDGAEVMTAARDATSRLHLRWTGLADPETWGQLLGAAPGAPIRQQGDRLKGTLINRLGLPLEHVSLIWIQNRIDRRGSGGAWLDPTMAGRPLVRGQWWSLVDGQLLPNETVSLDLITPSADSDLLGRVHDLQVSLSKRTGLLQDSQRVARQTMELMSLWSLVTPPPWAVPPPASDDETVRERRQRETPPAWGLPERRFGADLDLGPWLSSPALIVLGWIDAADIPVNLHIDGEPPTTQDGMILVRWILPLESRGDTAGEAS